MDRELERKAPEHIPEEQLEAYTLGSLSSNETAFVEEHLLFCATCQDQLEAVDCYARAMQGAAKRIREEQAGANSCPASWTGFRRGFIARFRCGLAPWP